MIFQQEFIIEEKFIYIKNYIYLSRRNKLEFFKLTGKFKNFRISNQKIILSDQSILIEFTENTDIDSAKRTIDEFFQKKAITNVETKILKQLLLDNKQIKMIFQNNEQKNLKLVL